MSSKYVSTAEVKQYLGINTAKYDSTLAMLIETCEGIFDGLIGSQTGLIENTKTEYHRVDDYSTQQQGTIFFLKTHNPTAITTYGGVAAGTRNVDYTLRGRRLELKNTLAFPSTFPYQWAIVYTSGYTAANLPADVKMAILILCNAFWTSKKATGISSFKQDLLSVTYDRAALDQIKDPAQLAEIRAIIWKYKIPTVYAT